MPVNFKKSVSAFNIVSFLFFSVQALALDKAKLSIKLNPNSKNEKSLIICPLSLVINGPSVQLTIQNNSTQITAYNIRSYFNDTALQDNVSETGNTCSVLTPGSTCILTYTPGGTVVPLTDYRIQGMHTQALTTSMEITDRAVINVTLPTQQNRIVPVSGAALNLTIMNDPSSTVIANAITVSNRSGCDGLIVNDSACTNVVPGGSCNLALTSSIPYAPCTLTISGSNTTSPTALIAFSYLGGLVFEGSGGGGKVVIDAVSGFMSNWTVPSTFTGATSNSSGFTNTNIITLSAACTGDPSTCAAQKCRDIGAVWYMPALNEFSSVHTALCSNNAIPCNFGGFVSAFYWSSTEVGNPNFAAVVSFPNGSTPTLTKASNVQVRCIQSF